MPKLAALVPALFSLLACGPLAAEDGSEPLNDGSAVSGSIGGVGSSGSLSTPGSAPGTPSTGLGAIFPTVPNNGGGVLASPQIVLVTFDGDPNQATLEADATWIATGGYLATVAGEYGVGNGSVTLERSSAVPPAPDQVESFLQSGLASGALPAYAPSHIYVLAIPRSAAGTADFCATDLGFHSYFVDADGQQPLYAVIPDCSGNLAQVEVTLAHEVVEASTDPLLETYQIQSPENPWSMLDGEVADLCASNGTTVHDSTGSFSAPLIWSNAAASQGETPCVPWPGGSAYLTLVPSPAATQSAPAGGTVQISLTGWASAPAGACNLIVAGQTIGDFGVTPTLSAQTVFPGASVTIALTVPVTARPGQRGAAWIGCVDPTTGVVGGSTVVAVAAAAGPTSD